MTTTRFKNRTFKDAGAWARRTNQYLMNDYISPPPTIIYLSMEETREMLTYRYKTAHRMGRARLEECVNRAAADEQNARKIACNFYFVVVGPDGEFDPPVFRARPVADPDEDRHYCGFAYETRQAEDDRVRYFRDTY